MFIKSLNHLRGSLFFMFFVLVVALSIGVSTTSSDTWNTNNTPASVFSPAVANPAADDLASEINKVLKIELEKEFGPLNGQIMSDETQIWGRLIAIDYELPEGNRLDDTWGVKVVEALGRLGITATFEGNEVRADGQTIAGKQALSMQLTTSRGLEDPDAIGFTAMFPQNN